MRPFASFPPLALLPILIFVNFTVLTAQSASIYRLPAGTRIRLKMDSEINSKVSSVNDTFTAVVSEPVVVRDIVVLPKGTTIEGRVASVSRAAVGGHDGQLNVVFESLRISSEARRNIDGVMVARIRAERSRFLSIVGRTSVFLLKGKDVRLREDQEFEIELKKEVVLPVTDY